MAKTTAAEAKRRLNAATKTKPSTEKQWAKVIKTAESVLKSAGVKF
ncbi:hypothetical protein [Rhizobium sp. NLR22b]|nr:hypothetical protein [Rhizobium sp. NLR22b]MBX5238639.1 hypothetical protein [Rhizobium sp. NLR22b]